MSYSKQGKIIGIFTTNPLLIFHYFLLTGVLFIAHEFSSPLEQIAMQGNYIPLFLFYVIVFYIGDSLIHYILGVD